MDNHHELLKYLPLTETTYYTLVALVEPNHGYGIMQKVRQISSGAVEIGPGTLYGAFSKLQKEGLILKVKEESRRKTYILTAKGKKVLHLQVKRLEVMTQAGLNVIKSLESAEMEETQ